MPESIKPTMAGGEKVVSPAKDCVLSITGFVMVIKVFVLGRPGSGKSVAAHRLSEAAWNKGIPAMRLGDYEILQKEARQEDDLCRAGTLSAEQRRFYLTEYDGFGVRDFRVLDRSLLILRERLDERGERAKDDRQLVILEFARNDYQHAFEVLGRETLRDALFLYVNAHVEECIARIKERTLHPTSSDDHYVPEAILSSYYQKDDGYDLASHLAAYAVPSNHVSIVENHGAQYQFASQVTKMSKMILHALESEPASASDSA